MKMSDSEKLLFIMLCESRGSSQSGSGCVDFDFVREAILTDNAWAIYWKYNRIIPFNNHETPDFAEEVASITSMWTFIEEAYESMSESQRLEASLGKSYEFPGFDERDEKRHYHAANFYVKRVCDESRFAGGIRDSHVETLPRYRKMLEYYESIGGATIDSAKQLSKLLSFYWSGNS